MKRAGGVRAVVVHSITPCRAPEHARGTSDVLRAFVGGRCAFECPVCGELVSFPFDSPAEATEAATAVERGIRDAC